MSITVSESWLLANHLESILFLIDDVWISSFCLLQILLLWHFFTCFLMSMCMCIYIYLVIHIPRSKIAGFHSTSIYTAKTFSRVLEPIYPPNNQASHLHKQLVFHFSHSDGYSMVLICIFLMINEVNPFYIYLLAIWLSLWNVNSSVSSILNKWVWSFLICRSSSYILDASSFLAFMNMYFVLLHTNICCWYLFSVLGLPFTLFNSVFW